MLNSRRRSVPSKDTVADMLGQDIAEMAEWYAREAVLGASWNA
jgi:hypothetical protein